MSRRVIGIDPSFAGFAACAGERILCVAAKGESIREKCRSLFAALSEFVVPYHPEIMLWVVEKPMPTERNVMHLYNMGHLMSHIYDLAEALADVEILEVPAGTLKIFVCDNGGANKIAVAVSVFDRWGVRFDGTGSDNKYDAYALWQFGLAHERGENPGVRPPKVKKPKKAAA